MRAGQVPLKSGTRFSMNAFGPSFASFDAKAAVPTAVEMAIKGHPDVYDVLVVGVQDERYGQSVTAVIQPHEGAAPGLEDVRSFLRSSLSGYKLPRSMVLVETIPRHATGKANYPKAKELATAPVG